jgi:hypothetical protein
VQCEQRKGSACGGGRFGADTQMQPLRRLDGRSLQVDKGDAVHAVGAVVSACVGSE